jgi:hypothetical protein
MKRTEGATSDLVDLVVLAHPTALTITLARTARMAHTTRLLDLPAASSPP